MQENGIKQLFFSLPLNAPYSSPKFVPRLTQRARHPRQLDTGVASITRQRDFAEHKGTGFPIANGRVCDWNESAWATGLRRYSAQPLSSL